MMRLLLLSTLLAVLTACGGPADLPGPGSGSAEGSGSEVSGPPPEPPSIRPNYDFDRPTRLTLALADAEGQLDGAALGKALAARWGMPLTVDVRTLGLTGASLFGAEPGGDALAAADIKALLGEDRVLVAAYAGGALSVREWLPGLDHWSPTWQQRCDAGEVGVRLIEASELLMGWSGRVVAVGVDADGDRFQVALRGSGLLLGRTPPVRRGEVGRFDYHVPGSPGRYRRIAGSFGTVTAVELGRDGVTLTLTRTGWYRPKVGDRWRRVYLPGGERALRVVDGGGRPLPGYVVYARDGEYSRRHDAYAGVTGPDGAVRLRSDRGQVRHVQVISTVEGVDFVFFQGVVAVAGGMRPWTVKLRISGDALVKRATQVARRLLSNQQMVELRRNIQAQLDASALRVRSGQYQEAIQKLEHALELLAGVENADATKLRRTVIRLSARYEATLKRERDLERQTEVLRELAKADHAIYAGNFKHGQALLEQALKQFPADLFPERARLIGAKLARARVLVQALETDLGRARQRLLRSAASASKETLSLEDLAAMEPLITQVARSGTRDVKLQYSDAELLGRLKLRLDRLSETLAGEVERLKAAYDNTDDVHDRTKMAERADRLHTFRKKVDEVLRVLIDELPAETDD